MTRNHGWYYVGLIKGEEYICNLPQKRLYARLDATHLRPVTREERNLVIKYLMGKRESQRLLQPVDITDRM